MPLDSTSVFLSGNISVKGSSFLNSEEILHEANMTPTKFTSVNSRELLNSLSYLFFADNDEGMASIVVHVIAHRLCLDFTGL